MLLLPQEVRTADDGVSSMEKNGANGNEATDWQKGNPQLSALLSQQQAPAVVINGAAAAGAVVSDMILSLSTLHNEAINYFFSRKACFRPGACCKKCYV